MDGLWFHCILYTLGSLLLVSPLPPPKKGRIIGREGEGEMERFFSRNSRCFSNCTPQLKKVKSTTWVLEARGQNPQREPARGFPR